jgi:hypothetical protein
MAELETKKPRKPRRSGPVEGRDYFCAGCGGTHWRACRMCFGGCSDCNGHGWAECYVCEGGRARLQPPDWM